MKYMSSLVSFSLTAITHETVVNSRPDEVTAVRIDGLSLERDLNLVFETGRVRARHTQAFIYFAQNRSES